MSEKITFRELIESIAEKTDNTEQFTHDFLKDFVNVIHDGLDNDGAVNVAGFGKFKLKRMDEREGFNPQTEEEITIPAHNKIVYSPYKGIREVVNAPYSHLEANLIEEEEQSDNEQQVSNTNSSSSTEENAKEQDFIPSAPPTEHEEESAKQEQKLSDPFDLDGEADESQVPYEFSFNDDEEQQETEESSDDTGDKDDDVIEFQGNPASEDHSEDATAWAETMISSDASAEETEQVEADDHETASAESDKNDNTIFKNDEDSRSDTTEQDDTIEVDDDNEKTSNYAPDDHQEAIVDEPNEERTTSASNKDYRNRNAGTPAGVWIAAAIILVVLAGGVLYFSVYSGSDTNTSQMASADKSTKASVTAPTNPQQTGQADEEKAANGETANTDGQPAQDQAKDNSGDEPKEEEPIKKESVQQAIEKGQTLWSIAEDKYGNPRLWPWIYGKNGKLTNPNQIAAGSSLSVPLPSGPNNRLNAADSVGVAKGFLATYQWYNGKKSSKAKHHLWAAMLYHQSIRDIADVQINKTDLSYAKSIR